MQTYYWIPAPLLPSCEARGKVLTPSLPALGLSFLSYEMGIIVADL